jgi:hypothetical protein
MELAPRQAEAMDDAAEPEWIDWHGGECPVPEGTRVEVRFRIEQTAERSDPENWRWDHRPEGGGGDIIAYRILGEQA